ncbi:hypothetical protein [Sorangium sp. So ce1078]|uniref:hypothetical protein n=1 Tax=Sorangium sp. So ce1078 TaxID=3133329 RepID=UPI003F6432F9
MLRRPDRAHPYYWASFIVSGNPGTLDGRPVEPDFTGDARPHVEPVRASTPGER